MNMRRVFVQAVRLMCLLGAALGLSGPAHGAALNPFTGLAVDDAVAQRRALLVKIANTANVRPQTGLALADVVVEHLSEGHITRFTALYLTHAPEKIGSVRSCRLIDLELPQIFDAALVCSGTSPGVQQLMRTSPAYLDNRTMIADLGRFSGCAGCPMYRTKDAPVPHNLFASAVNAWAVLTERGKNRPSAFSSWRFDAGAPAGGIAVKSVDILYRSGTVTWVYDSADGLWKRFYGRTPHTDRATRQTISAANVVVLYAHHAVTPIVEDVGGARSIEIQLWGQGLARVFRDGKMIDGNWRRPAQPGVLELVDFAGSPILLKPGQTWIEVVPLDFPVKAQQ
ncbi:MAG: DUF3048 domain-containing protein [Anaerolineae bacterium]|nr:DUF3048 domain-containing protein [Thermoflexales bacterium]MDW8407706.1 DUF3048 domain-containing protein [Anaerolineae bacterium]